MDLKRIKRRQNELGRDSGWSDLENHLDYFRICGGVALPWKGRPGFAVLIAEGVRNLRSEHAPTFYGLAEAKRTVDQELLFKCLELASITDTWYGNATWQAQRFALHQFNSKQAQKGLRRIELLDAPMLTDAGDPEQLFRYAEAEIHKGTLGTRKTVFLAECPQVRAALQRVPEGWNSAEEILNLPEAAALYYVLGAMFSFPTSIPSREPAFAKTEYDVFNPPWEKKKEDYDAGKP
jgi:hypothetical protein